LAAELITLAGSDVGLRIGTDGFYERFESACAELNDTVTQEVWNAQVDLLVLDPAIGFAELESGGQLDSSNVVGQPRKLVRAGLISGRLDLPLHFCCAYANAGEGRPIKGALPRYLVSGGADHGGLLVGSGWWERVLPEDVTFDEFLSIFHEVAADYEIAGPKEP
jgi:hypothetical protein